MVKGGEEGRRRRKDSLFLWKGLQKFKKSKLRNGTTTQ